MSSVGPELPTSEVDGAAATGPEATLPRVTVIVLTMSNDDAARAAVTSLTASLEWPPSSQRLLLGNGCAPPAVDGWNGLSTPTNLGVSGGRRHAASKADGEVLVFLDDDCTALSPDLLRRTARSFAADASLGALAYRIVARGTGRSLRHWQPRIGAGGELEPGDVTTFLGGGHAIRRTAYEQVGGYDPDFFYSHEETDLSWRLIDAGWRIRYEPDLAVDHPATEPDRNPAHVWHGARNRVWLAWQRLPIPLAIVYVGLWFGIQLSRVRSVAELTAMVTGTAAGFGLGDRRRQPMRWATVRQLTRLGRPPLI